MATSWGAAAAQGIESGFNLGLRGAQQKADEEERRRRAQQADAEAGERAEDRKLTRERMARADKREARIDKRQADTDERTARMDRIKMLDSELAELQTEGSGLWTQYGGFDKVPEDVRGQYSSRVRDARARRQAARREFYEPDVTERKRAAAETWSRIQAGQKSIDDLSDDELYETLTVQTRRPMSDFLRPKEGGPSPIEQAGLDLEAGMETGNMDLTLRAANVLLKPELATGIGTEGPDGNEIVDKRIVELVPHPQDPTQFVPIVEVTVKRDDGATGKYRAPISEGRGVYANDPGAMPKTLTIQAALERVGQLQTLAAAVNRPELRKRLDKAEAGPGKAGADEFLSALGSLGVTPPKKQISRERVDLGDRVLERELDASGNILKETPLRKGMAPQRAPGPTEGDRDAQRFERGLREGLAAGTITEAEATDARRRKLLGTKPAVEDKPLTESQAKANLFGKRMQSAEDIIDRIGTDYSPVAINTKMAAEETPLVGGLAGMAGNAMLSDNSQSVEQAQRDFLNAVLRRESGAVISPAEFKNGRKQYFPQPGDSKSTIEQKAANRRQAIEGMFDELPAHRKPTRGGGGSWDAAAPATRLPSDDKAARAAYDKLPKGARYIDPSGKERVKQ
jgi:hypothetical protein